ncbi:YfhO family protein [Geofilum rubicundum]|nr:YfhO family protein [Geofilum rubicundum]
MMDKIKPLLPYLAAIAFFIVITLIYFSPVLEGKKLPQMDNTHAIGMAQELVELEDETGERAQWTNSMFGGMPAYQIKADASANLFSYVNRAVRLGLPYHTVAIVFLYLLGFFILMRSMGFSHWLSIIGSLAFAFGSYNFIIIIAGHITKAYAIALMAPVIGGILYTYNKNKWGGALFTAVALGSEIAYNHVQITYYLALLVLILILDRLYRAIVDKTFPDFLQRTGLLAVAAVLAIMPNISNLWTTYEYGQESMRGQSLLAEETTQKKVSGLDPDYAFAWSYGKAETLTLLIPNFHGGASEPIGQDPDLGDGLQQRIAGFLSQKGINYGQQQPQFVNQLANEILQQSKYWGSKPFTSGPVYVGAIVCFLFVLALFFYQGREKWWLLAGTILSILLAWGNNLEWFNLFLFDHFPLYNKFRTVEMTLVLAALTMPVLALLGLKKVTETPQIIRENPNKFLLALGLTGGVALIFYLIPGSFLNFISEQELNAINAQKAANPDQAFIYDLFVQEMQFMRTNLLKTDAFRSLIFIALASGSLWFFSRNSISVKYLLPGLAILILVDLWGVDKRYLNNEHFESKRMVNQPFTATAADKMVLEDKDPNYRVFSVYRNPFNEVHTSYFHKSIGGYHGAKLQRYQDVIDWYIQNDLQVLRRMMQQSQPNEAIQTALQKMPVLNMLNTRYVIHNPEEEPVRNPFAMGNAWLVNDVLTVTSTRDEIEALAEVNLSETAIVHSEFAGILENQTVGAESGTIELTDYHPEKLTYQSETGSAQLAVFSEIYYNKGWKAFVNDTEVPVLRVNYLLRGIFVPGGTNTIEFRFEPASYRYGKALAYFGSVLILVLMVAWFIRRRKEQKRS